MLADFLSFLQSQQLLAKGSRTILLAVSGGVDSVVLCHLFKAAGLPFAIAHCNFNLRGAEADAETQFVEDLAQYHQVPFYTTRFETKIFASHNKVSTQMAARSLRYQFFYKLLDQYGWHQIATAHHWDDAVETILFNFIKGTGIRGFYGMQPINGKIIRPLLFARKKEIIHYAQQAKLHWKEDSSNQENHYQRNFIRNKVIPLLHQVNPNFEATTQATAEKLIDIGNFFQHQLNQLKKEICFVEDDIYYIAMHQIAHWPWAATVAFELLRPYGFTFKQIKPLITAPMTSGKVIYTKDYALHIDKKHWLISKKKPSNQPHQQEMVSANRGCIDYHNHTFYFRSHAKVDYTIQKTAMIAALDHHMLPFPLTIRPWQRGDFFYPLGMKGRKKISDLLIDLKIPMAIKEKVLVVTTQHQIVWVVGYRIDERFKVGDATEKVFEIELT